MLSLVKSEKSRGESTHPWVMGVGVGGWVPLLTVRVLNLIFLASPAASCVRNLVIHWKEAQ